MDTRPNSWYDMDSRYSTPGGLFGTDHDTDHYYTGQYIVCVLDYTTARIDVDDLMRYNLGLLDPVEGLLVQWQPRIDMSLVFSSQTY